jgi:hypothetical protein
VAEKAAVCAVVSLCVNTAVVSGVFSAEVADVCSVDKLPDSSLSFPQAENTNSTKNVIIIKADFFIVLPQNNDFRHKKSRHTTL